MRAAPIVGPTAAFLSVSDVNGMIYWLEPWKSKPP